MEKVVVFAWHTGVIHAIERELAPFGTVRLTGGETLKQREAAVAAFQKKGGPRVFVGQIEAAGVGITLTAASEVVFVESSWVPAENVQAAKRVHRIGQSRPVRIRFAYVHGSIDEQIQRALRTKAEIVREMMDPGYANSLAELLA